MSDDERKLTFMVVPGDGGETRSLEVSRRTAKVAGVLGGVLLLLVVVMAGSWWWFAAQATRVPGLRARIAELREENARVEELAESLTALEARYGQLRDMFGPRAPDEPGQIWLPPAAGGGGGGDAPDAEGEAGLPTSWPLTVRGFLTRPLLEEAGGVHPGIDIAVPMDSYVRAAGPGRVVDAGEDPVYGRFVLLEHAEGYRSLYGHASMILVSKGERVSRKQVIGLSGSTGRSTAPHLHFEIRQDGEPVDPLSLVEQP